MTRPDPSLHLIPGEAGRRVRRQVGLPAVQLFSLPIVDGNDVGRGREIVPEVFDELELLRRAQVEDGSFFMIHVLSSLTGVGWPITRPPIVTGRGTIDNESGLSEGTTGPMKCTIGFDTIIPRFGARPMATVTIELDDETARLLWDLAAAENRSTQDVCLEALDRFLKSQGRIAQTPVADRHASLRKMIGLVKEGPTDASIVHDKRDRGKRLDRE
jgi:hypothetical protein